MIQGKVWGTTERVLETPFLSIHRLKIEPHAQCSLHTHAHRWNAFLVTEGRLLIDVHQQAYPLVDVTELGSGDVTSVAPGLVHRFRTEAEPVECFEIYYPASLEGADIVRLDTGSRRGG